MNSTNAINSMNSINAMNAISLAPAEAGREPRAYSRENRERELDTCLCRHDNDACGTVCRLFGGCSAATLLQAVL